MKPFVPSNPPSAPIDERPLVEYRDRLAARRETLGHWVQLDARLSYARLGVVGVVASAAWLALGAHVLSPWWLVPPALVFVGLVVRHDQVIRARDAAATSVGFYERGLARIEDRWMGTGEPGLRFLGDLDHPYAQDLDVFGPGSLFELLWTARTHAGETTLAAWLTRAADATDIRARQEAIGALRGRLDLREALALAGQEVRGGVDTTALVEWATSGPTLTSAGPRVAAGLLAAGAVTSATWWAMGGPVGPLEIVVLLEVLFARVFQRRIHQVLDGADVSGLEALAHLLGRIEQEPTTAQRLSVLHRNLETGHVPASAAIHRLQRLLVIHDWRRNLLFVPVAGLLLWSVQVAWALDSWRRRFGPQVPMWLAAAGEFEALTCLAAYAYEHPGDSFPELSDGPSRFDGIGLGHPLIAASSMVRNDVRLMENTRLLVVSGSNMSGKSTLLRTVGVNAVLAMAGAPVRAERLVLTPLAVGATLRIQDSLQAGRSRFYAEVRKIRELLALADGPMPLLFLLDELFQGTNSHDRLVGAVGLLRSLLDRGAIGLVTTHDLALTALTDELNGRAVNVHFEDRVEEGTLSFDYQMHPGPVTRGNGLALMRAVGLDVGE
jgi:MutS-like protein